MGRKAVESITVRLDSEDARQLDEAAKLILPREVTRAKQIKRVVDVYPRVYADAMRAKRQLGDLRSMVCAVQVARCRVAELESELVDAQVALADALDALYQAEGTLL